MVKKKTKSSRYTKVKNLLHFLKAVENIYPKIDVEIQMYDRQHGSTFILLYGDKTIARMYPLLKGDCFTIQYKEKRQSRSMQVTDDLSNANALVLVSDMIKKEIGKHK